MKRIFLAIILTCVAIAASAGSVPDEAVLIEGLDEDSARYLLDHSDLQSIEGIWNYVAEEMTVAVLKWEGDNNIAYRIVLLESSDVELLPGTVIGYVATSADPFKFKIWIYSQQSRTKLASPLECVATLNEGKSMLKFDIPRYDIKLRMNFARFLPTLFRGVSIVPQKHEEQLPVGFNKQYPVEGNAAAHGKIRYL